MSTETIETNSTDGLHTYRAYDPQLAVPTKEGERVVKCLYKTPKTGANAGKAAGVNSYVVVPESHLDEKVMIEQVALLAPYMSAYFQSVEDGLVKEHHKSGGKGFSSTWLSLAKILESLDEAGQGNRLNKEKIGNWFGNEVQDMLQAAFADKLGISEAPSEAEMERLQQVTDVYKAKFESLASGKTMYKKEEAEQMQKALEVAEALDSSIGARFYGRLERMKSATSNELMMAL